MEGDLSTGVLRFPGKGGNELGALDDQVRSGERDLCGTSVGEKLKAADFVQDAGAGGGAELIAEMICDDERAGMWFEVPLRFEDADTATAAGETGGSVKTGGRSAYDDDFILHPGRPGKLLVVWHGLR